MAYSVRRLADRWECDTQTIYRMIGRGEIVGLRLGPKMLRITDEEVARYEARCKTNGDSAVTVEILQPSPDGARTDAELSSMRLTNKARRLLSDDSTSRRGD